MLQPLVSVIVPIYKVEPYLRRCLDSIVNQTYTNLEIILVDDGSPDGCPQICDEFATKDNRILVIHKENGGLSDARNAGLDISKGEYIYFLDGDDILPKNGINILLEILLREKAQIVSSSFKEFANDEQLSGETIQDTSYITMTGSEALVLLCTTNPPGIMSSCMKIYKSECFTNIRFPKGKLYEDAHTNYKIYHACKKICYTNAPLYYYRRHEGSIMANTNSSIYDLEAREERYLFLKENNEPAAQYCIEQLCWDYLIISVQPPTFFKTHNNLTTSHDALKKFKKFATDYLKTNQGSKLHRSLIKIFLFLPKSYQILYKLSPWHLRKTI